MYNRNPFRTLAKAFAAISMSSTMETPLYFQPPSEASYNNTPPAFPTHGRRQKARLRSTGKKQLRHGKAGRK